jgi:hypothetical protein
MQDIESREDNEIESIAVDEEGYVGKVETSFSFKSGRDSVNIV